MSVDTRQESIVFQNALGHAVQIMMHNAKVGGKHDVIDPREVIKLARLIARVSINPNLSEVRTDGK